MTSIFTIDPIVFVNEGGKATVTIRRSGDISDSHYIRLGESWRSSQLPAKINEDFASDFVGRELTINANQQEISFDIQTIDDDIYENLRSINWDGRGEHFDVIASISVGIRYGTQVKWIDLPGYSSPEGQVRIMINDNDPEPKVQSSPVNGGGGSGVGGGGSGGGSPGSGGSGGSTPPADPIGGGGSGSGVGGTGSGGIVNNSNTTNNGNNDTVVTGDGNTVGNTAVINNTTNVVNNNTTTNVTINNSSTTNSTTNNTNNITNNFSNIVGNITVELSSLIQGASSKSDAISGSGKDDALGAGKGADKLTGASGADQFVFNTRDTFGKKGADTITDFKPEEGDQIILSPDALQGLKTEPTLQAVTSKKALKAAQKSDSDLIYYQPFGQLFYDQNGSAKGFGSGGLFAVLSGAPVLEAVDLAVF